MYGFNFTICASQDILEYERAEQLATRMDNNGGLVPIDENAIKEFYLRHCGYNQELNVDIYSASCDIKKRISGFTEDGIAFNQFYKKKNFPCYYTSTEGILLLQSDIKTCHNYLRQYNKERKLGNRIKPISIDFDRVEQNVIINSCSAKSYNSANIKARLLYGNDLFDNEEYKKLKRTGKITSLTVEYQSDGKVYYALISGKGGVWIQNKDIPIVEALQITLKICNELLI